MYRVSSSFLVGTLCIGLLKKDASYFSRRPKVTVEQVETDGENPQHVGVMNAFVKHIKEGTPLVADGREGINGLMISNAMFLSSWLGETVTLPIDEEKFLELLNEKRKNSKHKEDKGISLSIEGSFGSTSQWTGK